MSSKVKSKKSNKQYGGGSELPIVKKPPPPIPPKKPKVSDIGAVVPTKFQTILNSADLIDEVKEYSRQKEEELYDDFIPKKTKDSVLSAYDLKTEELFVEIKKIKEELSKLNNTTCNTAGLQTDLENLLKTNKFRKTQLHGLLTDDPKGAIVQAKKNFNKIAMRIQNSDINDERKAAILVRTVLEDLQEAKDSKEKKLIKKGFFESMRDKFGQKGGDSSTKELSVLGILKEFSNYVTFYLMTASQEKFKNDPKLFLSQKQKDEFTDKLTKRIGQFYIKEKNGDVSYSDSNGDTNLLSKSSSPAKFILQAISSGLDKLNKISQFFDLQQKGGEPITDLLEKKIGDRITSSQKSSRQKYTTEISPEIHKTVFDTYDSQPDKGTTYKNTQKNLNLNIVKGSENKCIPEGLKKILKNLVLLQEQKDELLHMNMVTDNAKQTMVLPMEQAYDKFKNEISNKLKEIKELISILRTVNPSNREFAIRRKALSAKIASLYVYINNTLESLSSMQKDLGNKLAEKKKGWFGKIFQKGGAREKEKIIVPLEIIQEYTKLVNLAIVGKEKLQVPSDKKLDGLKMNPVTTENFKRIIADIVKDKSIVYQQLIDKSILIPLKSTTPYFVNDGNKKIYLPGLDQPEDQILNWIIEALESYKKQVDLFITNTEGEIYLAISSKLTDPKKW